MSQAMARGRGAAWVLLTGFAVAMAVVPAGAVGLPEIRSSPGNPVPACVTPERLMAFVATRNPHLAPKFAAIAEAYRDLGNAWQVRWDYAFFQMVLETNYLMFQRGDGSSGDVALTQNNFAGVGATGGGVPGDRFPDVRTGVLAHVQHLVVYSGERVDRPVATRTRENQGDIIEISHRLARPMTFQDLSRRWAVDRAYGKNIETIAELYRKSNCSGPSTVAAVPAGPQSHLGVPVPVPVRRMSAMTPPSRLGAAVPGESDGAGRSAASPVPADEARNPSPLVRTIWRRDEPQGKSLPQAATADVSPVAPPASAVDGGGAQFVTRDATGTATPLTDGGVARFAAAAQGAIAAGAVAVSSPCRLATIDTGGFPVVLIRSQADAEIRYTAVTMSDRAGGSVASNVRAQPRVSGENMGVFATREAAFVEARRLCAQR